MLRHFSDLYRSDGVANHFVGTNVAHDDHQIIRFHQCSHFQESTVEECEPIVIRWRLWELT